MSIFSQVAIDEPQKSVFDLSHSRKLTCKAGYIVPVFCQYTMPGDKFKISVGTFARTLALKAPMMQNVNVDIHFFSVPLRLVWQDWERFISGPEKPSYDSQGKPIWDPDPVHPYATLNMVQDINDWTTSSLADYLGFPVIKKSEKDQYTVSQLNPKFKIDTLPFRAYQKIYNDWYRDENLIDKPAPIMGSDKENVSNFNYWLLKLRSRAWKKDYFTSALPFPQRGEDVLLPLVDTQTGETNADGGKITAPITGSGSLQFYGGAGQVTKNTPETMAGPLVAGNKNLTLNMDFQGNSWMKADLSNLRSSTIIEIRRAFALQKWFENSARLGARYIEQMLSHFGVKSSDARLQRPEFIGGCSTPLVVDSVTQTSESGSTPQGTLAGNATAIGGESICDYYCEEHCIIMGLLTVRPQNQYILGIPRQFSMFERFDFPFPEFANIGEQAIKRKELYIPFSGEASYKSEDIFGYTPRYSEFKFIPSTIHGEFQDTLNYWTMARKFGATTKLNQSFIDITESKESNQRPFAYQGDEDNYLVQLNFDVTAVRPLPYYSIPGYLDH
nr:MAG: major capsid protein [Microviridae sp.]